MVGIGDEAGEDGDGNERNRTRGHAGANKVMSMWGGWRDEGEGVEKKDEAGWSRCNDEETLERSCGPGSQPADRSVGVSWVHAGDRSCDKPSAAAKMIRKSCRNTVHTVS